MTSPPRPPLQYTTFDDVHANRPEKVHRRAGWSTLVDEIKKPTKSLRKQDMPLLSLCSYGNKKSPNGSLRHSDNVLQVFGIEIDYDGEQVSPEEARTRLEKAGVQAIVYTTPSHTQAKPRWRALFPLSKPVMPKRRRELAGKANAILGGIAAKESFSLSSSYYFGKVQGTDYLCYLTNGEHTIDQTNIEPVYHQTKGNGHDGAENVPSTFDDTPDAVLLEAFEKGEGRYNATLILSARWARRGVPPETIRKRLHNQVSVAHKHDGIEPVTGHGEDLYRLVDKMADSAAAKFQKDGKAVAPIATEVHETLPWIKMSELLAEPAPLPRYTIDGWLNYPEVGLYAAHGGSGKSYVALEIAVRVALGISVFGQEVRKGNVLYISAEDDRHTLHGRLERITKGMESVGERLDEKLFLLDATEIDTTLYKAPDHYGVRPTITKGFSRLRAEILRLKPVLVILDNLVDHYDGNENDRGKVRAFVRKLRQLAKIGDGCTILLLAHVDANTLKEGEKGKGFSGSTAWYNSVRNQWYQYRDPDDADRCILKLQKINYGQPGAVVKIEWNMDTGKFDIGTSFRPTAKRYEYRILEVVRAAAAENDHIPTAMKGAHPATSAICRHWACPPELAKDPNGKRIIREVLAELLRNGVLEKRTIKKNRKPIEVYALGGRANTFFDAQEVA